MKKNFESFAFETNIFESSTLLKKNPLFYSKKYWQLGRQEIYCKFTGSVK